MVFNPHRANKTYFKKFCLTSLLPSLPCFFSRLKPTLNRNKKEREAEIEKENDSVEKKDEDNKNENEEEDKPTNASQNDGETSSDQKEKRAKTEDQPCAFHAKANQDKQRILEDKKNI